jgi:hypothetical protein
MKKRISWCDKLAPTIKHCGSWVCDKGWVNSKSGKRVHCSVCKKLNTVASLQTHPYSHNLEINQF